MKADEDSEEEDHSNSSEDEDKKSPDDANNTWLNKESTNEVEEFYNKYRDFEEEKRKDTNKTQFELLDKESEKINAVPTAVNRIIRGNENNECIIKTNNFVVEESVSNRENKNYQISNEVNCFHLDKPSNKGAKKTNKKIKQKMNSDNSEDTVVEVKFSVLKKYPITSVTGVNVNSSSLRKKQIKRKLPKSGSWSVTVAKNKSNQKRLKTSANNYMPNCVENDKLHSDFDDMFFEVEEKLNDTLKSKIETLKTLDENNKGSNGSKNVHIKPKENNNPSLEMRRKRIQVDIDEELDEISSDRPSEVLEGSVKNLVKKSKSLLGEKESNSNKSTNIEPNNFFYAKKPKYLASELPSSFARVEDNLDDDDVDGVTKQNEKSMTIHEAFACDDVDEEFK